MAAAAAAAPKGYHKNQQSREGRAAGYVQSSIYADEMRQSLVRTDDYDYRAAAVAASPSLTLKASCVLQLWETPQVEAAAAAAAADALVLRFLIN